TDFRVNFNPTNPNQLYGKQLECYVSYKCQRDYRLVEESAVSPPWLLTVDVSAHTFNGNNETFLPDTLICTNQLSFGPVLTSHNSYRTILLENKSNAPLLHHNLFLFLSLSPQNPSSAFTIKPSEGLVKSRFHISTLRLVPDRVDAYTGAVTLRLNDNPIHDQVLQLSGSGEQPELLLSNNGELFFRPTCVGTVNKGKYQVQNVGRLPLQFKWVLKHNDAECLSVEPLEGVIQPNEIQYHTWSFQPNSVKKYVCKPTCFAWAGSTQVARDTQDVRDARKFIVRVVGEGTEGDIKCETSSVYFGCVIAGSCTPEKLILYNDSQCDLHYRLHIDQCVNSHEPIGLKLSQSEGVISARSKTLITAIANPYRRVLYSWALYYELLNPAGESINPNSKILLCELGAEGVYPTLAVIDARTSGSGSSIGKTQLWRWFNLEQFNSCLDSDPQPAELMYSVNTRHSTSRRPSVYTKSILGFNFGAASVDSEPCHVSLMVNNTGSVNTEWAFLLPKDLELEMEYWAESGEFDKDELHELHIQDNELFTVTPNKGTLKAGESKMIVLTYKHDVPGTHRLPVLFKIEHGKEVLLNFIGVTVEPSRRYLHFPGTQHTFTPIPIGGPTPPKQLYEMFNGGAVALIYEVDTAPLHELQSHYDHPILTCINPRGEILPGSSANLEWIFSPLESKTYTVDIPIHVVGGETALITFKAIGYDSRALGATMPITDQPLEFTTVPSQQKVPVPGQLLFLSEERIGFGNVPLFSRSRHIIFLNNKSTERPLSYSWHAASDVVNDVLRIEPVQGYLQPGESAMTKVTFCAAGQPSFYDLDLICEVVDEIKLADYRSELTAWEAERERQLVEFTITDDDYDSQLSCSISKAEHKSYQTLPPIRFEDPVKLPSNRSRLLRKDEQVATDEWVQPQPPAPFIFHLGVTARTHDIAEYRSNFPHSSTKHYIDRTLQINCPTATKSPREQYSLSICNEEENEMIVSVMSNIIRGLLDDPTFQEAAKEAGSESIPYFPQLAREEEDLGLD
uniref:Abnormal spindle-like microcephaly-associated protein ASH domain-containing protein n=1 Tax=Ciona savignyi TaxID=51511 RepID=H2Y6N0_CIOSA